ncbi:hypothetical protein FA15DRAFT_671129 [Coprinopsis marcescibilis]|uniref:Uncharacterized protein n=1 Tax=Coprinopsis marcescibilis TaxID=230819 RepID=A0A5C3KQH8_COPMA|nr:hypothetical protein FA15DRAFT_671129 [Coprinopsis marcescibilis]
MDVNSSMERRTSIPSTSMDSYVNSYTTTSRPAKSLPSSLNTASNSRESPEQEKERFAEEYRKTVTIVFWYKGNTEPLRIQQAAASFPYFSLSRLGNLISDLGLDSNSYVDTYNSGSAQWEQHTPTTVRVVGMQQRLLYRIRKSLFEGLREEDCIGLREEVQLQNHYAHMDGGSIHVSSATRTSLSGASQDTSGSTSQKRYATDSLEHHHPPKVHIPNSYYCEQVDVPGNNVPPSLPTPPSSGDPMNTPTPSNESDYLYRSQPQTNAQQQQQQSVQAPAQHQHTQQQHHHHAQQQQQQQQQTQDQQGQSEQHQRRQQRDQEQHQHQRQPHPHTYYGVPTAPPDHGQLPAYLTDPKAVAPPIPYHPHPPLKRWPNDYTVCELTAGFTAMDILIGQAPSGSNMTQKIAFERVFGSRYVKSTVCRHRSIWKKADPTLRQQFEALGTVDGAVWGEFVRRIEGRPPGKAGAQETAPTQGVIDYGQPSSSSSSGASPEDHHEDPVMDSLQMRTSQGTVSSMPTAGSMGNQNLNVYDTSNSLAQHLPSAARA